MSAQPPLPGFPPAVPHPRRQRPAWEAEIARLDTLWRERAARDGRRYADSIAALQGQIEDLRHRLTDLERVAGLADLARAPIGRGELRRFAGGRA